jgi:hypothetical protein
MQTTKIPATIVTGFLGSGKTTLMRHILEQAKGLRVAVIVNEFGELGIDGEILKTCAIGCKEEGGADTQSGQIYELANGCMCCTVQEEFFPVMKALAERRADIDVLLIETSGLALPKPLVQAFQWPDIRTRATVDGVVALIVKMDDLGLKLAGRTSPRSQRLGLLLVAGMPKVLTWLSVIGTAAMLWVGGHILLVGFDELGWSAPYYRVHQLEELVHGVPAVGGVLAWTVNTAASALVGLVVGALLVVVVERLPFPRARGKRAVHGG